MKRAFCIFVLTGVAACSQETSNASPPERPSPSANPTAVPDGRAASARWLVTVNPPDVTTAFGDTVPSINVFAPKVTSQALLDALAPYVSLATWPEQTVVDIDKVAIAAGDQDDAGAIQLRPKLQLTDRWYAVRVTGLPETMAFPRYAASRDLADGVTAWRFRTGSGPVVASMELCEKDGQQSGGVLFSERIDPGPDPSALIEFDRTDCHYLPRPVTGTPDDASDQTTDVVLFTCDAVGDVTVTWKAGATSASVSTIPVPATVFSLRKSAMEDVGDSCRRLMADI